MSALFEAATPNPAGHRDARPEQVFAERCATRIVDVRDPDEFTGPLGHVPCAELVPLRSIGAAATSWNRDEAVVLVCRSGRRSGQAANALTASGFRRVVNMVGGMLAWNEARLPVARASR